MKGWSITASQWMTVAVGVFLVVPLPMIVLVSLTAGSIVTFPPQGISLRWYIDLAGSDRWRDAALNSLVVGLISSVIATAAGLLLAISSWLAGPVWRQITFGAMIAAQILPAAVFVVGIFLILAKAHLLGTRLGLGFGHAILSMPIVYLAILSTLNSFDRRLIHAARIMGATLPAAWMGILIPHIAPAALVGLVTSFMISFDEVVFAVFIGQGTAVTIPNLIWREIGSDVSPILGAVAVSTGAVGIGLQAFAVVWISRKAKIKDFQVATTGGR